MKDTSRQREHFESVAARYSTARSSSNHLLLKKLLWRLFLSEPWVSEIRTGSSLLEPMCGIGEGGDYLLPLMRPQCRYKGFDYSDEMVSRARKIHPDREVVASDVTTYSDETTYDAMVLIGGLHHVYSHTSDVLGILRSCLKPGALFLNIEPTHDNLLYKAIRKGIYKKNALFDADTEQGFEYSEYVGLFKEAGFELVDCVHFGLLAYVFYYNPDAFPGLNLGAEKTVRALFALDRLFMRTWIGRKLSFATFAVWRKV